MANVDNMTDDQLRAKLVEYGFPVMPITGATRKTLAKKLKMLMDNESKISKDNRRSLGRYSSEDESDNDIKVTRRTNKRATMAAPPMRPPSPTVTSRIASTRKSARGDDSSSSSIPVKREVKTVTTTRTTKILSAAANKSDEFDTGSESDEVADRFSSSYKKDSYSDGYAKKTPSPSRLPSSYLSASSAAESATERLNQMKSRLSQYNSGYDRPLYTSSPNSPDDILREKENTPFLSNFTKRLSQLSDNPKTSFDYKSDIIKESDLNGGGATAKNYLSSYRVGRGRPTSYDFKSSTNQSIFKNNFVPFMVLVVAFLFFIIVAVVYLGIRSNTSLELSAVVPICVRTDPEMKRYENCVVEGDGVKAINLLKALEFELNKVAVRAQCDAQTHKSYMSEADIFNYINANYNVRDDTKISNDLTNLQVLSFFNPAWGVQVVQVDNDGDEKFEVLKKMGQVIAAKKSKTVGLLTTRPYIPWKCYIYNTFSTVISIFTSILISVVILFLINHGYKFFRQYQQKQREEEVAMVENIIDILQSNCSESTDDNYMVINHVRDMILPIQERKKKENVWKKAVQFIGEHESRIRTEIQVVRGEPAEVWRWLGGPNLNTSKSKSWQGQAFETQVGSVNSLPCSPTPCLKIRGMVEEGERNTVQIKKAVLSKCAHQCRILHCAVDLNSNCVYLKCADPSDAAVAYRNLHGWWYAGNLVTVKYLRLERYMQRFPDSPVSGPPFLQ